jgi:nucleoside 2-deoxyribosyltransferase
MIVYLAGGMYNDWRTRVKKYCPQFTYLDPMEHDLKNAQEYTIWDLLAVRNADLIFAHQDSENPAGYGTNLELGYAFALGKFIIFVNEMKEEDERHPWFGMAESVSNVAFYEMEPALELLSRIEEILDD